MTPQVSKRIPITIVSLVALFLIAAGAVAQTTAAGAQATFRDVESTLGEVPMFLEVFPEEAVGPAWSHMKALQLNPDTALSGKVKELVGLAVAAQIPCEYCVYFHTQAAKVHGAQEAEIEEAVAMAALTRHWSTVLNGLAADEDEFRRQTETIMQHLRSTSAQASSTQTSAARTSPSGQTEATAGVMDADRARADARATLGAVPVFLERFPDAAVGPAWQTMKELQLDPDTALPGKVKELVGLAVAAQVPCDYCVTFHTEAAKLHGATEEEIEEAVAMAGLTRQWSTVINGSSIERTRFERQTDEIMTHLREAAEEPQERTARGREN